MTADFLREGHLDARQADTNAKLDDQGNLVIARALAEARTARMSPLTALFLGIFGVAAVVVTTAGATVLYGLSILDNKSSAIISFAGDTIEGLPELIAALPPALADVLNDRRAPEYASSLDVGVRFVSDRKTGSIRPVITVENKGDEVVSMLALRVAAMDRDGIPIRDWTAVVATPIAIDDEWEDGWRGPLMPGATRRVVLRRWKSPSLDSSDVVTGAIEISDVRVWEPDASM
ncbi:MAG: hypothetical protein IIB59_04615 [Planctomycetes bacterium]|nr:hypothetical protein [Planctomycetota bacterium]